MAEGKMNRAKTAMSSMLMSLALAGNATADEITYTTLDGNTVFADELLAPEGKDAPLLILFHQAGANGRAEYKHAIPRLQALGFSLLVVDQSSGGERFGGANRTVAARGKSSSYCEAYPDLEATINYVELSGYGGPVFAFGSSYSAGLVVRLGADYSDMLNGVVAFSPASGGPMKDCSPNPYAETTKAPTMVVRPAREMQMPSAKDQYALFEQHGHTMFVHEGGVHGSSTLDPERTKASTEVAWNAVLAFLAEHQ
jgi:dienelactone hydrolase